MSDLAEFLNFKWKSNVHGRIAYIIKLPKIKRYYDLLYTSWPKMTAGVPAIIRFVFMSVHKANGNAEGPNSAILFLHFFQRSCATLGYTTTAVGTDCWEMYYFIP